VSGRITEGSIIGEGKGKEMLSQEYDLFRMGEDSKIGNQTELQGIALTGDDRLPEPLTKAPRVLPFVSEVKLRCWSSSRSRSSKTPLTA
jgi:hypothetical protein